MATIQIAFVSVGSMMDVGWGDLIYYLGDDPKTKSIVIYMESIGDARSFLSAAREVALTKPIIVIKAGRTEAAGKAATPAAASSQGATPQTGGDRPEEFVSSYGEDTTAPGEDAAKEPGSTEATKRRKRASGKNGKDDQ